ncbi:Os03g0199050, partial [Oryza sativa Japonica Group]
MISYKKNREIYYNIPKCGGLGEEERVIPHGHERQLVQHPVHHREHHRGRRRRGDPRPTPTLNLTIAPFPRSPSPRGRPRARRRRLDAPPPGTIPTGGRDREAHTPGRREGGSGGEGRRAPSSHAAEGRPRRRGEEQRHGHG